MGKHPHQANQKPIIEVSVMANRNSKSEVRLTKSKTCQERNIKVNQIHYMRKLKDDPAGAGRPVPRIQLKGYWLQQAGFEINTPVKVRVMNGCLVLTIE
jgi:toxic protein SymE